MNSLRFRQVHLDFHTSPHIQGIGEKFDKKHFQRTLKNAHIDSITCFSSCHHGYSYHPTKVGTMHPHLKFDLLGAQIEACKEVDINVPIYLTAGVNDLALEENPQWRQIGPDGRYLGWSPDIFTPAFKTICFNSPYVEHLCRMVEEAVIRYPDCDGVFLDIFIQQQCCCKYCLEVMKKNDLNPAVEQDRIKCAELALERYLKMVVPVVRRDNPDMPVFHNDGHIRKDKLDWIEKYFSHMEMESLPTGGYGYDDFVVTAKFAMNTKYEYIAQTGKFHTTWGEFGGFKSSNALLYETAAMIAFGGRCGIGDQLHPCGKLDESTYENIGKAYAEVEKKEPWCVGAKNVADIAIVSEEAVNKLHILAREDSTPDTGTARALLENHYLFDMIDENMDLDRYKMIILPDTIKIQSSFKSKIQEYIDQGGKVLLSGDSGFDADGKCMFDIGADVGPNSDFDPDYILPEESLRSEFVKTPMVMYGNSRQVKANGANSLGEIYYPYFNRTAEHFCSHQHTPYDLSGSGYDCGVVNGNVMYLAHKVFSIYRLYGAVAYRHYIENCIDLLLGDDKTLEVNLPSTARVSLMDQPEKKRFVLHLLYAEKTLRGGHINMSGGTVQNVGATVEVIEDLLPIYDTDVVFVTDRKISKVTVEPQCRELDFIYANGKLSFNLDKFTTHAMLALQY